jgi:transcriptional regulator with XRE-family HTH domain
MSMKAPSIPQSGWIRQLRLSRGMSMSDLAKQAGVSQPTVLKWEERERSGTITLATLRRAAEALDADFGYLLAARAEIPPVAPRLKPGPKPGRPSALAKARQTKSSDPNLIWQ